MILIMACKTLDKELDRVIELLERASLEDEWALDILGMQEGVDFDLPQPFDPTKDKEKLEREVRLMVYHVAGLGQCQLSHIQQISERMLSYVLYAYHTFVKEPLSHALVLEGPAVAHSCLEAVEDVLSTVEMLRRAQEIEESRGRRRPGVGEGESDESDGQMEVEEEKAEVAGRHPAEREEDVEVSRGGEVVTAQKEEEGGSPGKGHHLDRTCKVAGCRGYTGPNLRRHLRDVHLQRLHIGEDDVGRLFQLGKEGQEARGPRRRTSGERKRLGRRKRWCPIPGCDFLGAYLPRHLRTVHRMRPGSAAYVGSLKMARRFIGEEEELAAVVPPPPPIVEVFTSQAHVFKM